MRTVLAGYYFISERYSDALQNEKEQGLDVMRSYKIRKMRRTVSHDLDRCLW